MRVIFTTKKTEENDKARQREYQAEEERRRAEDSRRSDVSDERGIWADVLRTRLEQEALLHDAVREADEALAMYRERFQ
jgi:hypothetical protein